MVRKGQMKIRKKGLYKDIELELVLIKKYPRYGLYQVYLLEKDKRIPIYQETYTRLQLKELRENDYFIKEEVFS